VAGRPPATSRADVERAAFGLFAERGFEPTTVNDIAAAAGISRRTFFRYFGTKNDVVWGEFRAGLARFRAGLEASDPAAPWPVALRQAVVAFNHVEPAQIPVHRQRMELILHVPALQAYSTLMYAEWRAVVRDFVAARLVPSDEFTARLVGHAALAGAVAAYEQWLARPGSDLEPLLDRAMRWLESPAGTA
jgi:TetR/AcrR family transcriptional regulator, regulator of mycofactocin system